MYSVYGDPIAEAQQLNNAVSQINSQVHLGGKAGIAWNYRKQRVFSSFETEDGILTQLSYPRIKKISNGDLLMVFQEGQISESIYMTRSRDKGLTWEKPVAMRQRWFDEERNDYICYATGELLELQDGTLLFACSVRGREGYRANLGDGIEVLLSRDNGHHWNEPILAYDGANWEPQMIQLPSGEIQMFFTQQAPYFAQGLLDSVDIGMIRSFDGGLTWSGKLPGEQWRVKSLSRLPQNGSDGKAFSDGMPVAVVLNEGEGIVYACESLKTEEKVSIVYSSMEQNWDYPEYMPDSIGPGPDRRWNAIGDISGYAPYLIQMRSGETVLCFNTANSISGSFQVGLGDCRARNFSGFQSPFPNEFFAYWGSLYPKNDHTVMAVAMAAAKDADPHRKVILYGEGQLNHTVQVMRQTAPVDGSSNGWSDDSVFFLGSRSQAQVTIRLAYDSESLYVLAERLDEHITYRPKENLKDSIEIWLNMDERIAKFQFSLDGLDLCQCGAADSCVRQEISVATRVYGTVNDDSDTDIGFVTEAAIPWHVLGGKPSNHQIGINAVLHNADGQLVTRETLAPEAPEDWYTVILN